MVNPISLTASIYSSFLMHFPAFNSVRSLFHWACYLASTFNAQGVCFFASVKASRHGGFGYLLVATPRSRQSIQAKHLPYQNLEAAHEIGTEYKNPKIDSNYHERVLVYNGSKQVF